MKINWSETNGITRGLVAAYPFKEGSGTIIEDLANGNNGTLTNGPTWAGSPFGNSISFDGSNDFVDCGSIGDFTSDFSISFWMYTRNLSNSPVVIYKGNFNTSGYYIQLNNNGNHEVKFETNQSGSNTTVISNVNTIIDITWQHYVCTLKSTTGYIYLNGQQVKTGSLTAPVSSSSNFKICTYGGSSGFELNALITNLNIWNRALSASEVARLYADPYIMYRFPDNRWFKSAAIAGIFNKIFFPRQAVNRASTY